MFESAEIGRKISKSEFKAIQPDLKLELIDLQNRLRKADFPTLIVFAGVDGAGKSQMVNVLSNWMDPRWIATNAYGPRSDEEQERPYFWRYWRDLPGKGEIGLFLSSWYSAPVVDAAYERIDDGALDSLLTHITAYERMLADEGALILKFWLHLGKKAQKDRLKTLEKDPDEAWRVTKQHWKHYKMYDRFVTAAERALTLTSLSHAPWSVIEGSDERYRELAVLTELRDAGNRHLAERAALAERIQLAESVSLAAVRSHKAGASEREGDCRPEDVPELVNQPGRLDRLDMSKSLSKASYRQKLRHWRAKLAVAQRRAKAEGLSTVLVFEGWDAAGKGGAIRRIASAMDARDYRIYPIAAPTDEEKSHHHLWRFWRRLGRAGRVIIFDRSWYGRVLVERIEGYATEDEWFRGYSEIRDFEAQLVEHGTLLLKFWVHITPEEQLARFESRRDDPTRAWKLTEDDWRNREKWSQYQNAAEEMFERTSLSTAPWILVEGNDKAHARVKILKTLAESLEKRLES